MAFFLSINRHSPFLIGSRRLQTFKRLTVMLAFLDNAIELGSGAFLEMILVVGNSVVRAFSLSGPSFINILSFDSTLVDNDLLQRICDMLHWSWTVQFRLIKRKANATADWLAKNGAMGDADLVTCIEPGEDLRSLLKHDTIVLL
ncbi:hypothetical protein PIB30_034835 [Stylosanthes scabra]|uniref:RNase H type-1 domain-containing protein n=1 Tax=Stylosanthes scabra TaxID=79078 RepID=A0ABU6XEA0_9FABA|nr:hypothetical protein [Stylosanthes scabra]